jgi:hypothetical protein
MSLLFAAYDLTVAVLFWAGRRWRSARLPVFGAFWWYTFRQKCVLADSNKLQCSQCCVRLDLFSF